MKPEYVSQDYLPSNKNLSTAFEHISATSLELFASTLDDLYLCTLQFLDVSDIVTLSGTSKAIRTATLSSDIWRLLYIDMGWATADQKRTLDRPPQFWLSLFRRKVLGVVTIRVELLTGGEIEILLRLTDDLFALKKKVRELQEKRDKYEIVDFELLDTSTGEELGVQGEPLLPPNNLHTFIPDDIWDTRLQSWKMSVHQKNSLWETKLSNIVDGTLLKQKLTRKRPRSLSSGGITSEFDHAFSEEGEGSSETVSPLFPRDVNKEKFLQSLVDGKLEALVTRFKCIPKAEAELLDLLHQASHLLGNELGSRFWKIGYKKTFHPLLDLGFRKGIGWSTRMRLVHQWIRLTWKGFNVRRISRRGLAQGVLTYGAPWLMANFLLKIVPNVLKRLVNRPSYSLSLNQYGVLYVDDGGILDSIWLATVLTFALVRTSAPFLSLGTLIETLRYLYGSIVTAEGAACDAACIAVSLGLCPAVTSSFAFLRSRRKNAIDASLRFMASAAAWKVAEHTLVNHKRLMLIPAYVLGIPMAVVWTVVRIKMTLGH